MKKDLITVIKVYDRLKKKKKTMEKISSLGKLPENLIRHIMYDSEYLSVYRTREREN